MEKNAAAKNLEGLKEIAVRISPKKFNAKKNLLSGSREDRMVTLAYDRKQVDLSDFKLPDLHLAELRMAYKSAVATQGGPLLGALKTQRNVSVGIAEFKNVKDYFLACEDSRESRGISFFSNRWDDHGWGYDYRKAWSYADENADLINQDMRERAIKWASERVAKDLNVPDDPRAKALGYPEEMWIPDYNLMKLVPSLDKARGRFPNLEEIEVEESGKVQGVFGLAWQPADWNPKIRNYSIVIQNPLSEYIREYPVFRKIEWDKDLNPHESYNFDR